MAENEKESLEHELEREVLRSVLVAVQELRGMCLAGSIPARRRAASVLLKYHGHILRDRSLSSANTAELAMMAVPLLVQTVGKRAILDAVGVDNNPGDES